MVITVGPVSKANPSAGRSGRRDHPGSVVALDDGHLEAGSHQMAGGTQTGQAGADDDDPAAHRPNVR